MSGALKFDTFIDSQKTWKQTISNFLKPFLCLKKKESFGHIRCGHPDNFHTYAEVHCSDGVSITSYEKPTFAPHPRSLPLIPPRDVWVLVNLLTLMSDQERISPYNINTTSRRYVMRIKEIINKGIDRWSNTKFSELTSEVLYSRQYGELLERSRSGRINPQKNLTQSW